MPGAMSNQFNVKLRKSAFFPGEYKEAPIIIARISLYSIPN